MTKPKIKINDDPKLREVLDQEYETASQIQLCEYALMLVTHIRELVDSSNLDNEIIEEGLFINEQWQKGKARVHNLRQAGFKIHKLAKTSEDALISTALRVIGHAVATGHMKEHAMVASDYAVKVINLKYPMDMEAVKKERLWQIDELKEIKKSNQG